MKRTISFLLILLLLTALLPAAVGMAIPGEPAAEEILTLASMMTMLE